MDFDRAFMAENGFGRYSAIALPPHLKCYIAYRTDLSEGSEILHSRLRDDYNAGEPKVLAAIQEWASLTDEVRRALAASDLTALHKALNRNFDLRCEVCGSSVSSKNRRMVELARSCGASAKLTGSGGAIIGFYDDDAMFDAMREKLAAAQITLLKPEIVTGGDEAVSA